MEHKYLEAIQFGKAQFECPICHSPLVKVSSEINVTIYDKKGMPRENNCAFFDEKWKCSKCGNNFTPSIRLKKLLGMLGEGKITNGFGGNYE